MAEYVIPPKAVIIRCRNCKALYVPDMEKSRRWHDGGFMAFEQCPVCEFNDNRQTEIIPLWRYNLIKLFRGGFKKEMK